MFDFFHTLIAQIIAVFVGTTIIASPSTPIEIKPMNVGSSTVPEVVSQPISTTTVAVVPSAPKKSHVVIPSKPQNVVSESVIQIATPAITHAPETPKTTIVTLPSGAVVEMDQSGNILRTIKEATQTAYVPPPVAQIPASATISNSQSPTLAPVIVPKYGIEYQHFSREYNGDETYTLNYRLKSQSSSAPDIVKIITRIYAAVDSEQSAQTLDTWIRTSGSFNNLNETSNLSYLGYAKEIVPQDGTTVFQYILIFEKTQYQIYIPAMNVSSEISFKLREHTPSSVSNMYIKSIDIHATDGNTYSI